MAQEMTFDGSIVASTTNFREAIQPGQILIDLTDTTMESGVKNIDDTAAGVTFATGDNATDGGVFFFRNLSASHTLEIGIKPASTFLGFLRLKPGEYAIGRLGSSYPATTDLYAKCMDGGQTADLQYKIFDGT